MKIVALLAAYNEADVIEQVVADLIAQGLSVHFIDHGSSDGTAEAVQPWLGRGVLAVERFPDESGFPPDTAGVFAWESLLLRKEQLAEELDADWFLHTDADELREGPFPGRTLAEAIADVDRMGYNAIDFSVVNFVPTDEEFAAGKDLRSHFQYYQPAREFDRLQIKCWKKHAPVDLRSSGGHEARFAGRRIFPIRFLDRHYPVRGQAHGERKVFVDRKPRFVDAERQRGWHVQYDDIVPGHRFIRDPSQLRRFDAAAAQRALFEAHRGAEAESDRARQLAETLEERTRALAVREQQTEEWQGEALAARRVVDDTRQDLEASRQSLDEARRELGSARKHVEEIQRERELLRRVLAEAEISGASSRRELESSRAEEERLRERLRTQEEALEQRAAELARLRRDLADRAHQHERTLADARELESQLRAHMDAVGGALRDAEVRIDDIYASRTWRWSAPGRLLWRLLRR